jgi:hypothetical protein
MTRDQYTLTDPAKLYADIEPHAQRQPEPGLDAKLDPRAGALPGEGDRGGGADAGVAAGDEGLAAGQPTGAAVGLFAEVCPTRSRTRSASPASCATRASRC